MGKDNENDDPGRLRAARGEQIGRERSTMFMKPRSPAQTENRRQTSILRGPPPKKNRIFPWRYDHELYKKRNEVERAFRRIKRFRCVFTRYEKLDVMRLAFVTFAFAIDMLRLH